VAAVAAAAALGVAWYTERVVGIVPCALCLLERWPYRVAVVLGLLAAFVPGRWAGVARVLLVATLVAGAGIGMVHVGVERGWWASPLPECAAPVFAGGTVAERLARMPARPGKPCDAPTYLAPGLPLSMAAMNVVLALVLAGGVAISRPYLRRA